MNLLTLTGPAALVVDAVLKGTLFLAVLFLIGPVLHRLSAGARHIVWGTGLVLLVALPLLSRYSPWRIGILPAVEAPVSTPSHAPQRADLGDAAAAVDLQSPTSPATSTGASAPSSSEAAPTAAAAAATRLGVGEILFVVWLVGFGLALIRLFFAQRSADRLVAGARPLTDLAWEDPREIAAARLGLEKTPAVMITSALPLPVTTGLRKPVVLLPEEAADWSAERRESVLLHEMAHVARWDIGTHLVAQAICAAWWFHPLAWRALQRLRAESERAADDLVLTAGRRASEYAQDLLAVVQSAGRSRAPVHALAMAQRSDFEGRLLAILEPGASRRGVTPMTAVPLVLAVSLAALPLAAIGPARAATPAPDVAAESQVPRTPMPAPTPSPAPMPAPTPRVSVGSVRTPMVVVTPRVGPIHVNVSPNLRGLNVRVGSGSSAGDRQAALGLVPALSDQDAQVRLSAARGLGNLGVSDTTVVSALAQALASDADDGVRRAAAWSLGQLESHAAVPALSAALRRDRDIEVRRNCAWALGQIEDAGSVDALQAVLSDPDHELREKAVWALGQIEDSKSVAALVGVLHDADPDVRSQAAWALGQIGSKDAVQGLSGAVSDTSAHMRSQVAWALGQISDAGAVPALSKLAKDPNADVRKQAVWALGQIESKSSIGVLGDALKDSDADVRKQAAWALGQISDPSSADALVGALRDDNGEVKKNAAWALGQLDLHAIPQGLIAAFSDGDGEVRKNAAWAAGQIGDPAAIEGLTRLLSDGDRDVQKNALWALGQIDDPRALEPVTRLLRSNDAELRRMAAEALGRGH